MKRGPKPDPAQVKQLFGITSPSRLHNELPAPETEFLTPDWLWIKEQEPPSIEATYERVRRCLRSMKMETEGDSSLVHSYVLAVNVMDRMAKVMAQAPVIVRDANGQPGPNPLTGSLQRQAHHVAQLGALLGLSGPSSRMVDRDQVIGSTARTDRLLA